MSDNEFEVAGKIYRVERGRGGNVEVTIDGKAVSLEIVEQGPGFLRVRHDGRVVDVRVARVDREYMVALPGRTLSVKPADTATPTASAGAHGPILSPITGRVILVKVENGARVTARQPVAVIEAMKMENEVLAPVDGIIQDIRVRVGDPIDQGAALMRLDPVE